MSAGRLAATLLVLVIAALPAATPAAAATPRCQPCAGLTVAHLEEVVAALASPPVLTDESVLFVRLETEAALVDEEVVRSLAASPAVPWLSFTFRAPAPLFDHLEELEAELAALARVARAAGPRAHIQVRWQGLEDTVEYAFLLKRASAAVGGVQPDARLVSDTIPLADDYLERLYAEELAAYLDGVAAAPEELSGLTGIEARLAEVDPGAVVVIDGAPAPAEPTETLTVAAGHAEAGADITLFAPSDRPAETLAALKLLAREFSGDVSLDPYSRPQAERRAWSFVRGDDLSIRVIAARPPGAEQLDLIFSDTGLRDPALIDPETGTAIPQWGYRRSEQGLELSLVAARPVIVLSLQRMTAEELEGIQGLEEEVIVADTRQMPVEEILRRLQAFEDAQNRRIQNYRARNTTHLRFQGGTGAQSVETTFAGAYFFRRGEGFEWVWENLLVNGIEWRSKTIPEIPLFEPEKAAALPVEITFTREYRYSLRGTALVEGRDCWVVDFEPAVAVEPGRTLFRGTVWVDRELYTRVKTRAVQLGLEGGEVLSNEETSIFSPVDASGAPAPWAAESYFLPLRLIGQQLWSILSATAIVEREIVLTGVAINAADFDERRNEALASELTMVRDTPEGLRYLVADEATGERQVKEGFDTKKRFIVGGVFYDESQDYPIPLAGMNWLWFDWRGTGAQANVFFAGPLMTVAFSDPSVKGSKFDAGLDVFALAIKGSDTFFRDRREAREEEIESTNPNIDFKLGRPIGNFFKLDLRYQLGYRLYSRGDETSEDFVLPKDHFNHELSLIGRYNRRGYRFRAVGSYNLRGDWRPWGLPDSADYSTDHDDYVTWEVGLGKTWHLPKFLKFGAEIEYASGSDLDRFSKFEFGTFADIQVHGYQTNKVRAEEVLATHLTYGFDIGNVFRVDLVGDAAWATDEVSGLDQELLAGVGIAGTVVGPWQTIINADIGVAVAGPDDGVSALVAFLKLFD